MTGDCFTVGVVTPHAAAGPEVELPAMTGGRVIAVVSRTASPPAEPQPPSRTAAPARSPERLRSPNHAELRASTEPAALDRAAEAFGDTSIAAIVHASTTCGYVIGRREESDLVERLAHRFHVPAVATCAAVTAALRTHRIGQVQLVHPPWFDDELDELGAGYFRSQGFDPLVTRAASLPDDPLRVDPGAVVDWVEHHVEDRAQAVFLAGNGFRATGVVEELELRTGRLVLAANQVLLWGILSARADGCEISGHGRLLRSSTSGP